LLLPFSIIGIIVVAISIYFEYRARQNDYLVLLKKQATLFINTLSSSTENAITAAKEVEDEINSRILASVKIIERWDQNNPLSKDRLEELLVISDVEALQVYDARGKLLFQAKKKSSSISAIPMPILQPRLKGAHNDTILTLYDPQSSDKERLAAVVRRKNGGLIAGIIGKEDIQSLRRVLGIGYFLKRFQSEENIEYVVIQNSETIVAGSFNGYPISPFYKDPLLQDILNNNENQSRILHYENRLVFETISPFNLDEQPFGVLRLGLSMEEYERLKKDVNKRLYIFAVVLIVFGLIFVNFFISYRHRKLLHRDLGRLQDYTNTILENLLSGVISLDQNGRIQTINKQALVLLNVEYHKVINHPFTVLPASLHNVIEDCLVSSKHHPSITRHWITSEDRRKLIALRTTVLEDEEIKKNWVLLVDDITDQTRLEEQIRRNQRLTAMRNLASAVAHEIKNPLNSIRLIVDLIRKKYKPVEEREAFSRHLETVREEINRISSIVEQYLRFARPPKLTFTSVKFPDLCKELAILFESDLKKKNITLKQQLEYHQPIKGDRDQLKQVFINLIKNSEEAIEQSGEISITGKATDFWYEIRVEDNGKGISEKELNSIFDLHFTTKKNGNGIGLSVVQQIISAHDGKIDVESEASQGTTVILQFPLGNFDDGNRG